MTLSILVAQDRWQDFDRAWKERMASEEGLRDLFVALKLAGERKRIARCIPLLREHVQLLEAGDRHAEGAQLLGTALLAGGNPTELSSDLLRLSQAAWSKEAWWPIYSTTFGLVEGSMDLRAPWRWFSRALAFQKGSLVNHAGGWGVGEITETRGEDCRICVRFWNGRADHFPLNAAAEIFDPLDDEDLKSQHFRDPEGLRKRVKEEPLEFLRHVVTTSHGVANATTVRNSLAQIGIEGSAWTAWWRKARKLAESSGWFELSGGTQKTVIKLMLSARDPIASFRRQLDQARTASDVVARVREVFAAETMEDGVRVLATAALEHVAAASTTTRTERVSAWILLREANGETPAGLRALLEELALLNSSGDPSVAAPLWVLFQELAVARDQERALELLQELHGDKWVDEAVKNLQHAASGMVRPLVDAIDKAGRRSDLQAQYAALLARPLRAPALLVTLAKLFEEGELPADFPSPTQRAHALLSLASHLFEARRGNAHLARVHQRLLDLLAGQPRPLLRRLLADADAPTLHGLQAVLARGVEAAIDHVVTEIALEHDRQFFAHELTPFWAGDAILSTRGGLERRSGELKELREVKIPANADAIGRAASFGDLSENSEWEMAIEEQRTLTTRAMEIEEELRRVELIENAALPEDTVCPGTIVTFKEIATGRDREITILGPWDDHLGDEVVTYRAPLAAGMLGLRPGARKAIQLPSGVLEVEVRSVRPWELV
jgi:transcription elongation factor GreA